MRILTGPEAYQPAPGRPLVLGIGNFDGLHLGHQALLDHVLQQAAQEKGTAAVLTFQNHPQQVLHPESRPALLLSPLHRLLLFAERGLQLCFWLPFTEAFSKVRAREFVEKILVGQLAVREVVMGYNAFFGYRREGDSRLMAQLADEMGFRFRCIEPVQAGGDYVSSSRVRKLVAAGRMEEAAVCLGHAFRFLGRVYHGDGRGRSLGFPTANLEILQDIMPPPGVYPARARILDLEAPRMGEAGDFRVLRRTEWQSGILNFGYRPTFQGGESQALPELHLFDFDGDLYGRQVEVALGPRIREEKAFDSAETLKKQIAEDVKVCREKLAAGAFEPG